MSLKRIKRNQFLAFSVNTYQYLYTGLYISDCIFPSLFIFVSISIFPPHSLSGAHFHSLSPNHFLSVYTFFPHPSILVPIAIHIYFIRIYSNYCSYLDFLISIYYSPNLFLFNSIYAHHLLLSI